MIQFIYKLFIGVLLATTIGMGIATFYPAPVMPEHPAEKYPYSQPTKEHSTAAPAPEQIRKQEEYDRKYRDYTQRQEHYSRNVALIAMGLSLAVLIVSLTVLTKADLIADGLILGGIFTLLYGIIGSFGSGEQKLIFLITLVSLLVVLVLGYIKFVKPEKIQAEKPAIKRIRK